MKRIVKKLLPDVVVQKLRNMKTQKAHAAKADAFALDPWMGDFSSLAEANSSAGSKGYIQNKDGFVEYTKSCAGKGSYIAHETKDIHVLCGLLWVLNQLDPAPRRKLRVLDFGGGLGNRYFSIKSLFPAPGLTWVVVELSQLANWGKETFADPDLTFHSGLEAVTTQAFDVVIAVGVLQQVEAPVETLKKLFSLSVPYAIIENHFVWNGDKDRIAVRKKSRYSLRIQAEQNANAMIKGCGFDCVATWAEPQISEMIDGEFVRSKSYLLKRPSGKV